MAKSSRYATTRIAATVNARYCPNDHITDSYFLDGKFTRKRETRAADCTVDREDRGFLNAVFAYPSDQAERAAEAAFADTFVQLAEAVNGPNKSIDTLINEFADCAVDVCGKITLNHQGVRQSYFAGVIVKEDEFVAVTTAAGCAFLYRGDVLHPLTKSDFQLEAIDYNGNPVDRQHDYTCGVAATLRYSSIGKVQPQDSIILCNIEVMEALGQREVLRILSVAEDQEDAAGTIITAAAAQMPGVSMQMMISYIANITPAEKTGRLNIGIFQTGQVPPVRQNNGAADAWANETPRQQGQNRAAGGRPNASDKQRGQLPLGATTVYVPPVYGQIGDDWSEQGGDYYPEAEEGAVAPARPPYQNPSFEEGRRYAQRGAQAPYQNQTEAAWDDATESAYDDYGYEGEGATYTDHSEQGTYQEESNYEGANDAAYYDEFGSDYPESTPNDGFAAGYDELDPNYNYDGQYNDSDYAQDDYQDNNYAADSQYAGAAFDDGTYEAEGNYQADPYQADGYYQDDYDQANYEGAYEPAYEGDYDQGYGDEDGYDQGYNDSYNGAYPEQYDEDYQEQYNADYQDDYADYPNDNTKMKRIIYYAVLLVVIAVCIFALVKLLWPKSDVTKDNPQTTPNTTATQAAPVASTPPTQPSASAQNTTLGTPQATTADAQTPTTAAQPSANAQGQLYIVKANDTMWGIISSYYGEYSDTLLAYVLKANPNIPADATIAEGQEIVLPPKPTN